MDVYIHAGKRILAEFWATGCDEEVNSRMLKYKKEIDFFLPRSASDFLLLECRIPGFSVVSFKYSAECGVSCTMPDSAMPMQPDIAQMLD